MLDTLAQAWAANNDGANIWADKSVTFLDPCTKSGVFLREITSRLTEGLKDAIPDLQKRVDHILTKQVFGIGITQITSLLARRSVYCSKYANGEHSIAESFTDEAGNIWFERNEHTWEGNKCKYCGAPKTILDRSEGVENYAYPFIHTDDIKTWMSEKLGGDMQFDVVIGNPPYQLSSDGGTRDVPIYQKFVEQAKLLDPRSLSLVIPARWMASGLGLNEFREIMLNDRRITNLVDFPQARDVFPGVEIKGGVCYFLWQQDHNGKAEFVSVRNNVSSKPSMRDLSEFDVLVRDEIGVKILRKVLAAQGKSITEILSVDKEFGWTSNFEEFHSRPGRGDVPIHYGRHGKHLVAYVRDKQITKSRHLIDKWKVMISQAYGAGETIPHQILGKPFIAEAPSVCTQTYLFFSVADRDEAESLCSYIHTRFFRFLVSLRKITQHATRSTYLWVPTQSWSTKWTDERLLEKYGLTSDEAAHIESVIRPMDADDE
jgi:site-specific DNA-methyltransferase (adenine-specific)